MARTRDSGQPVPTRLPDPRPAPLGRRPPKIPAELVPKHVAVVMDGNGRWAKERGLPRTEGHKVGEGVVLDVLKGCLEMGVKNLSLYAFSTENWKRSPEEVRFLMNFNRDVIRRRRDEMNELGIRIRWVGRMPKMWKSVVQELQVAQEQTVDNDAMTLYFCVNYGGRAEIADAAQAIARDVAAGQARPVEGQREDVRASTCTTPTCRTSTCSCGPSGEQRTSNYLLWQSQLRRDGVPGRAVAGLRPARPVAGLPRVRLPRPPLRRRHPQRGALAGEERQPGFRGAGNRASRGAPRTPRRGAGICAAGRRRPARHHRPEGTMAVVSRPPAGGG